VGTQHVGGTVAAQEALVEIGDGRPIDEDERHLGVVGGALGSQHVLRQAHPPHQVDGHHRLLVGAVHPRRGSWDHARARS